MDGLRVETDRVGFTLDGRRCQNAELTLNPPRCNLVHYPKLAQFGAQGLGLGFNRVQVLGLMVVDSSAHGG